MDTKRIDPEPIVIFAAVVATYSAAVSTVNYIKTHYKPLPSVARAKVLASVNSLDDHTRRLTADVAIIEEIFKNAKFVGNSKAIRLGNGAYLVHADFVRYEHTSDQILGRLKDVHKLCLKMEREATRAGPIPATATNEIGETYTRLQSLMEFRDLTHEKSWKEIREVAAGLQRAIAELRKQLGAGGRDPDA